MPTDPRSAAVADIARTIDEALAVLTIEWTESPAPSWETWGRAWPGLIQLPADGGGFEYTRAERAFDEERLVPGEILAELVAWAARAAHQSIDFGAYPG